MKEYQHQLDLINKYGVEVAGMMNEEYERGFDDAMILWVVRGLFIGIIATLAVVAIVL